MNGGNGRWRCIDDSRESRHPATLATADVARRGERKKGKKKKGEKKRKRERERERRKKKGVRREDGREKTVARVAMSRARVCVKGGKEREGGGGRGKKPRFDEENVCREIKARALER